jgi:hypothetical protein
MTYRYQPGEVLDVSNREALRWIVSGDDGRFDLVEPEHFRRGHWVCVTCDRRVSEGECEHMRAVADFLQPPPDTRPRGRVVPSMFLD